MSKKVKTLVVGPFMVNCYLYWDDHTGDGVIIDPGDEGEVIIEAVRKAGFKPRAILITHGHIDHIAAVSQVKDEFALPLYIGRGEEPLLADPVSNASAFFNAPLVVPAPDFLLADEEVFKIGSLVFRVLATPGHTPGGICYLDESEGLVFCGDTLFQGSIGRTDLPGGSYAQLIDSIEKKLLTLPDNITCLSGHGPGTTIGAERHSNPFLAGGYYA
ncbi:MAG: MBL fold metallo-hydrolase [candidate division Zixibacteria bacterium]|nr:MBL fold metallo-hydrolase [candidate division Zixibacteria bacterium]MDD5427348.1 MBL fold metallo-hydrolase [candidate division Zixibacteria bacterium]